jgi:hypothetical protein
MDNYTIQNTFVEETLYIYFRTNLDTIASVTIVNYNQYKNNFIKLQSNLYNKENISISFEGLDGLVIHKNGFDNIIFSNISSNNFQLRFHLKINDEIKKMLNEIIQHCN